MNKKILIASAALAASAVFADVMWDGTAYDYRVVTGLDDGTETSGYWYTYDDSNDNGTSVIEWLDGDGTNGHVGTIYSDDALDPVIDACAALCFTVTLNEGYDYPYVGLGFNVTGGDQTGGDASSWGGLDIQISSTGKSVLELAPEDEATVTEYNNYSATIASTSGSATIKSFAWSAFSQESGWGNTVDISAVYGDLAAVKVKISGLTNGSTYTYYVYKIGTYGSLSPIASSTKASSSVKAMLSGRTLSFSGVNSAARAEIINLQGQVVMNSTISGSSALNLSSLNSGVYMVRLAGQGVNYTQRITLK